MKLEFEITKRWVEHLVGEDIGKKDFKKLQELMYTSEYFADRVDDLIINIYFDDIKE